MNAEEDITSVPSMQYKSAEVSTSTASSSILDNNLGHNDHEKSDSQTNDDQEVRDLARTLTSQSNFSHVDGNNPFSPVKDSSLDPYSSYFKPRSWMKALLHLHSRDPERYPARTAGVAFRGLSVHGYGNATDYQKSVGNVWLEAVGMARRLVGSNAQSKIDILQDFDGLVDSGEMLVVLGPPGSGCSTLLKTIAGETHGVHVGENSYLNYQGL